MIAFKGFNDWIEIFAGGQQTDTNGRTHDGDWFIDRAVETFDPAYHEPPHVIGHPADDAPAYGWISAVKSEVVDGVKRLLAKSTQMVPQFEESVKAGAYKKRSAAFYSDGRLRHVGWLGAVPPAVKGLADVRFAEKEALIFEFAESSPWSWNALADLFRRLREWIIEKDGRQAADAVIPEWPLADLEAEKARKLTPDPGKGENLMEFSEFIEALQFWKKFQKDPASAGTPPLAAGQTEGAQFTEADLKAAEEKASQKAKEKAAAEFAETRRQEAKKARDAGIVAFCEKLKTDGKLPPAWVNKGLAGFMQSLEAEQTVASSEGSQKQTPLEFFKSLLEELGTSPLFAEIATRDRAGASRQEADADQKLGREIAAKVG